MEGERGKRLLTPRLVLNPKTEETRSLAFRHLTSEASEGQSAMEMVILYWVSLEERSQPCCCPDGPVPSSSPAPAHSLCHTHLQESLHMLRQVSLWATLICRLR